VDAKRYQRAIEEDIEVTASYGNGIYQVNGSRGVNYLVNSQEESCTCPDWRDRKPDGGCKHIIKVRVDDEPAPSKRLSRKTSSSTESTNNKGSNNFNTDLNYSDNWKGIRQDALDRDGWECHFCGNDRDSGVSLHVHHIEPKSEGGPDTLENLITLCRDCHEKLHGWTIPDSSPCAITSSQSSSTESQITNSQSSSTSSQSRHNDHPSVSKSTDTSQRKSSKSSRQTSSNKANNATEESLLSAIIELISQPAIYGILVNSLIVVVFVEFIFEYMSVAVGNSIAVVLFIVLSAYQFAIVVSRPASEFPSIFLFSIVLFSHIFSLLGIEYE